MKVNVIIDGNYLLYKNVFILKNIRRLKQDLYEVLGNELTKIKKTYPFDNVYFVSDSKSVSWRKLMNKEYKSTRKKDDSIDWEFVYDTYKKFKNDIKLKKNIKFFEMSGVEGDDLIAHIIDISNKNNQSNVIVGSDKDLNQLLKFDLNNKFINMQWNYKFNDERIYLPQNYQLLINNMSNDVDDNIFELNNSSEFINYIEDIINRTKVTTVDIAEFTFCKIIQGDKGDNIPSCVYVKDKKIDENGRGIGESGAKKIYNTYKEIYPETIDIHSDEFLENLSNVIIYHKKLKADNAKETIVENLKFNRKMMILNEIYMPKDIYDDMSSQFVTVENKTITHELDDIKQESEYTQIEEEKEEDIINTYSGENFNPDNFWEI